MLDPNFGKRAIPISERTSAVNLLKNKLIRSSTRTSNLTSNDISVELEEKEQISNAEILERMIICFLTITKMKPRSMTLILK